MRKIKIKKPKEKESSLFLILALVALIFSYIGIPLLWIFSIVLILFSVFRGRTEWLIALGVIFLIMSGVIFLLKNPFYSQEFLVLGLTLLISGVIFSFFLKKENIRNKIEKALYPIKNFISNISRHKKDFVLWAIIIFIVWFTKISFFYAAFTLFVSYFLIFHFKETVFWNYKVFPYFLIIFLVLVILKDFYPEVFSKNISFRFLFLTLLSSVFLTAFFQEPARLLEDDFERNKNIKISDYIFLGILAVVSGILVYLKIRNLSQISFLAYVVPILASAVVLIVSLLFLKEKDVVFQDQSEEPEKKMENNIIKSKKNSIKDIFILGTLVFLLIFIYLSDKKIKNASKNFSDYSSKASGIKLGYRDLAPNKFPYKAVQKLVYKGILDNSYTESLLPNKRCKAGYFLKLFIDSAGIDISSYFGKDSLIYFKKVTDRDIFYPYLIFALEHNFIDNNFDIDADISLKKIISFVQKTYTTRYNEKDLQFLLKKDIPSAKLIKTNTPLTKGEVIQIIVNIMGMNGTLKLSP